KSITASVGKVNSYGDNKAKPLKSAQSPSAKAIQSAKGKIFLNFLLTNPDGHAIISCSQLI
ncbi:hypothetical protein, partial [Ruminococcus champanellensis]|uniref:hypothetical protein n=1 Tax=Ruminococcus champanellensis TaxID=1161942 RepID=UPI001A98483D